MNHPRQAWRYVSLPGITGLLLLAILSTTVQAAEKDELASAQRQLDQVQAAFERAHVAAAQADPAEQGRFF